MMIDSLEMSDVDRTSIVQQCIEADEDKIVITHGTDTMVETATILAKSFISKTIVITGAMIPYKFGSSRYQDCQSIHSSSAYSLHIASSF